MNLITCVLWFIIIVELSACTTHALTTKEVPLYIRQSWIKVSEPYRTACICESGVNPTAAFKSIMNTEVPNNPCLKCYYKCLYVKMNLMEQTTGALIEKEFVRQVEGCTSEVFKKCNEKTKNEVDLLKLTVCLSFLFVANAKLFLCNIDPLTTKEVLLYIRQSWVKLSDPIRTAFISESGVNPTMAFKSMMNTEISNNPSLKCYYKCIGVKLNLMEATTGIFIENEFLRQVEGVTPKVFKKCNDKTKDIVDLRNKCFEMTLCIVHSVLVPKSHAPMKQD
ncbi:hypothetical protein RN001_009954 [Aquatica leii]|uniref:Uncharacterized protein n=1 Tax=Aquatica leii TaxID=1421715 RepID=A0AAN7P7A5_9COLE|nr:hypothetical protein RN001_009954 [Aquatica leii]